MHRAENEAERVRRVLVVYDTKLAKMWKSTNAIYIKEKCQLVSDFYSILRYISHSVLE